MNRWTAPAQPAAVLFDLDGTLLDTAPDMIAALNTICAEEGANAVAYDRARPFVSNGAAGLLRLAFPGFDALKDSALQQRYLDRYAERLAVETQLFPHLDTLLAALEDAAVPWGVVTNKPMYLTDPLMEALGLHRRSACTVSGDTLAERKPHPRPILFALEQIAVDPARSIYIGDARRDIESGRAAGTATVAVRYGYVEPGQDPVAWGADYVVDTPLALLALLKINE
ncbi:MAG: phosphoglycolate phosphatase [Chromatiales bacterium]|jgi:phosphoglycolate phosphatase|nr:MAG: phosphoglycolate phosphatase [Chromatiales bacterium]